MTILEAVLAVAAIVFVVWAIFKGGQLLDAVFMAALSADEPEPEPHEHLLGDPQ